MIEAASDALPFTIKRRGRRSRTEDAVRRILANRRMLACAILLAVVIFACLAGPHLTPHGFNTIYWEHIEEAPSLAEGFLFGTDSNGRDLLVRVMYGGQVSLEVALAATIVSLLIGVAYGAVAGYFGGLVDDLMMRVVDMLYCLPFLFFVILLAVAFGQNILIVFLAIGAVEWLDLARVVRSQVLSLKHKEFVDAARTLGVPTRRIIRRHILPNLSGIIIVYTTLTVPRIILLESALGYLGLGVQEPMASWGVLVADGSKVMETAPWVLFFPAAALTLTVLCLNIVGDGLRDAFDPKSEQV
jgi:oligopeptide transport system permease protein